MASISATAFSTGTSDMIGLAGPTMSTALAEVTHSTAVYFSRTSPAVPLGNVCCVLMPPFNVRYRP